MIAALLLLWVQASGPSTTVAVEAAAVARPAADVGPDDGRVAVDHVRAGVELVQPLGPADVLKVAGSADVLRYDWAGATAGLPEDLRAFRLEGAYRHAFDARWSGVVLGSVQLQFEEGADADDGRSYGVGAGALHRFGPELTAGALARVITRTEGRPYVFLLPYIEWKPAPSWAIRTEAREGLGLEATRFLDDAGAWSLQARLVYQERRFRLDADAIRPEGVLEDARLTLAAGLRWRPSPGLHVSLTAGLDLRQTFTLEDREGRRGVEYETESGPLVGVHLGWTF